MRGDRGFRRALIVAVSCLGLMVPVTAAGMSSASAAVADAPAASLGVAGTAEPAFRPEHGAARHR
jgi:hypothetical protein